MHSLAVTGFARPSEYLRDVPPNALWRTSGCATLPQLGLGGLRDNVRNALSFVPSTVNAALLSAARTLAGKLGGGTNAGKNNGTMAASDTFTTGPTSHPQTLRLWVTKDSKNSEVKIQDVAGGQVFTLSAKDFWTSKGQQDIGVLQAAAQKLVNDSKPNPQGQSAPIPKLQQDQQNIVKAEKVVDKDVQAGLCKNFTGCFAAGSVMATPAGLRTIESFRPGDPILARDEFDPYGPIEVKTVEEVFQRTGRILHVHVHAEVIRTTPEHPFFIRGKGWIAAGALQVGDFVHTRSGEWVKVTDLLDTGCYETVYNLRVADHHTYFVGEGGIWAHNTLCGGDLSVDDLKLLRLELVSGNKRVVLAKDTSYTITTEGHTATYITNGEGQLMTVTFGINAPKFVALPRLATSYDTTQIGGRGQAGDVGFHIVGDQFYGSNYYPNLVPANSVLNSYGKNGGAYGNLEWLWRQAVNVGKSVTGISVVLIYASNVALRPSGFDVDFTINGHPFFEEMPNKPFRLPPSEVARIEAAIGP